MSRPQPAQPLRWPAQPFWPVTGVSGVLALLTSGVLLSFYSQTGQWQYLGLSGIAAVIVAAHGLAGWLAWTRGRYGPGIWLIASVQIASVLLIPLILADFWLIGLVLLLIVPIQVGVADRLDRIPLFAILALLAAAGMLAIDLLGIPNRLTLLAGQPVAVVLALGLLGLHLAALFVLMWRLRLRDPLGLATKQTLVFTLISIGSIVLVTSVLTAQIRSSQITRVGQNFQTLASINAERVGNHLEQQVDSLGGFGQRSTILLDGLAAANSAYPSSEADARRLLQEREQRWQAAPEASDFVLQYLDNPQSLELSRFRGADSLYGDLLLIDRRGGLVAAQGGRPLKYFYGDEAWWQAAGREGGAGVYLGQLALDPQTPLDSIFIAVGIPNPGTNQTVGVLAATYSLGAIEAAISAASRQAAAEVRLLNTEGLVLAAAQNAGVGRLAPLQSLLADSQAGGTGSPSEPNWLMGTDSQGQAVVLGQALVQTTRQVSLDPLRPLGWRVVVSDTQAQALAEVTRSTKVASLVGLLAIALGVIAASATARVITRPINALTATAAAISAGSLEQRAEPVGPVELVTLAEAFNTLTARHRSLINSLQDQVNQRTTELARQNEYLAALHDTTLGVVSRLDLNDLLHAIVTRAGQLLGTRHGFIYLATAGEAELERQVGVGVFGDNRAPRLKRGEGLSGKVWESGQPLVVNDYDAWPGRSPVGVNLVHAMAGVPLYSGARVVGVIALASERGSERTFGDEEIQLLNRFAQLASVALDNARLFAETQQRVRELAAINSISQALASQFELGAVIELVGDKLRQTFDAHSVSVGLYDRAAQLIHFPYDVDDGQRQAGQPIRLGEGLASQIIETGQPVLVNHNFEAYLSERGLPLSGPPARSYLGVPILVGDVVIGAISVQNLRQEGRFDEADVRLLTTIAANVGVAIENARLFAETQRRLRELESINNISQAIVSQLELSAIIDLVGEGLREVFGTQYIFIALYDPQTRLIYFPYFWEVDRRVITDQPQAFGQGLTSAIIETRQPQLINDDWERRALALGATDLFGAVPKASLGVPILVGEDVIGVIMLQSTEREHLFDGGDVRLLTTIAAAVGVAIENARLFKEIQKAKEIAEAANDAKSMFLANVSHELRTPLTSVLGFTKLIQRRLEERVLPLVPLEDLKVERAVEQIRENIEIIIREGGRLTALINEVLDLAKIEAGKAELHLRPVHVEDVIDHALAATGALFEPKGLSLIREVPAGLPVVLGDQDRLIQVVINLISNAVKFTERGSVTCQARQADGHIIVSVIDTGIGLAPADQRKVFDKFMQAGDTLTNKPQGTGLGLSICKQIVETHGGRIWVDSLGRPGSGSTFAFILPVWNGPAPQDNTELRTAVLAGSPEK